MSAEITPERIARMRRYPCISDVDDLLKALESSRAEVQRLKRERDAAIDERNAWRSGDQDSRIEADRLRGEVQRLTEEARRSDAGRVEVEPSEIDAAWNDYATLNSAMLSNDPDADLEVFSAGFRAGASRLSPSPQPSADVVVVPREEYMLLQTCESVLRGSGPVYFSGRPLDDLDCFRSSTNHDAQDAGEG